MRFSSSDGCERARSSYSIRPNCYHSEPYIPNLNIHTHPKIARVNGPFEDNREFTNVRRRRQNDGYQYNNINPIAEKKWIIDLSPYE